MNENHLRSRELHDLPYLFPFISLIAMDEAFSAGGLAPLEWTFFQAILCIRQEFIAFPASAGLCFMMSAAIHSHHCFNGFNFPGYTTIFK